MDVESAKIRAKGLLLLNTDILEILASEDDNTSLSNQERELVFLDLCQLGELKTFDFSAHARGQFGYLELGVLRVKEMGFSFVCFQSAIYKFEWLGWWKFSGFIVDREIVIIFVLWSVNIASMVWRGRLTEVC
jgi:hypothetical protein